MYVYSTIAFGINFNGVIINGGAGVANKHLWTPQGVVTNLTDEEYDQVKAYPPFLDYIKSGHFVVSSTENDPNKVAKDMNKDNSAAQMSTEELTKTTGAKSKSK